MLKFMFTYTVWFLQTAPAQIKHKARTRLCGKAKCSALSLLWEGIGSPCGAGGFL